MASGEVSAAVEDFLKAQWTVTPLLFENKTAFESTLAPSAGLACPPATPAPFVEVSFSGRSYGQQSIGAVPMEANRWDEEGLIFFDVLVPVNTGSRTARAYAKRLADLFRGRDDLLGGDLVFYDAVIGVGQRSGRYNGNYFVIPLDQEFRRIDSPQT